MNMIWYDGDGRTEVNAVEMRAILLQLLDMDGNTFEMVPTIDVDVVLILLPGAPL